MDSFSEHQLAAEELLPLVRERLEMGHRVRYLPFRGVSMLPMLRQKLDSVELAPLPQRLKKYDLPVYQYPSGKVVMHRIVNVREQDYVCLGDNTYSYEYITHDQMIGVVSAFKRGERRVDVANPLYQLYCRVWVFAYPLRKVWRKCWLGFKALVRRVLK